MSESSVLAVPEARHVYSNEERLALIEVEREERLFELAQRKAKVYAGSSMVPVHYRNNIGNVLIAENIAKRMGADTLMVMQNLYIVNGTPGWSSQFLIATFNACGRFATIKYRFSGKPGEDDYGCVAYTKELSTGELIEGPKITWKMAKDEGWVGKKGSKWMTMPDHMFRLRGAAFMVRSTAPEIGMGLMTKEELEDMGQESTVPHSLTAKTLDELAEKLRHKNVVEVFGDAAVAEVDVSDSKVDGCDIGIEASSVDAAARLTKDDRKDVTVEAGSAQPPADPMAEYKSMIESAQSVEHLKMVGLKLKKNGVGLSDDQRKFLIGRIEAKRQELELA